MDALCYNIGCDSNSALLLAFAEFCARVTEVSPMSYRQKGTGIGSVFQELGRRIAGLFRFKNRDIKASREGNRPVFPPAGSYSDEKRRLNTDQTVIFTDSEFKKTQKRQNLSDTMYVPNLPDAGLSGKRSGALFVPRTKKPNFVLGVILTSFKLGLAAIFVLIAVGSGVVMGLANAYLETTPDLDVGKIQNQALSSFVYNQDGTQRIATYTGSENRDWITLDQIPLDLQHAVIAKEDIRFYSHNGVDVKRLMGALVSNLTSSNVTGGSTITQQLIKNSILTNERSYKRKLQEAYLAMELEKKYKKDQVLEAYLNTIPLGGTIYGVKTAAKEYFGKNLNELTLKQEVCLAAVIESPHLYDPHRATYTSKDPNKDVGALQNKMNQVTERMYSAGFITKQQYDETFVPKSVWDSPNFLEQWKSTMGILEKSPSSTLYPYPHFIEYVIYNVETMFLRKENLQDTNANRALVDNQIRQNGYKIFCTIDQDIQNTVQSTISGWDRYPAFKNKSDNTKKMSDGTEVIEPQVSSVVIDNQTGYIVAMIGSRDTPTAAKTLNRAYQAPMPVGSSIKPLAVYGPAFDGGLSPATPIANVPVPINGWVSDEGYPTTSQGKPYGPTPIRRGIVESLNIVAARTLMDYVGIENSASYLEKLNVNMENVNKTGVGLALGSSALTTLEMAGGYATIANNGYYREPVAFTKVEDKDGNVVLNADDYRKQYQVYKPSTAYMLVDVLTNAVDSGTGHSAALPGIKVAGKTGTVVDNRGVFFAGMTGYYTSTLWVGHDGYKEFASGTAASNSSAPLWQKYMSQIYKQKGLGDKPIIDKTAEEEGVITGSCDAIMGGQAIDGVPANSDLFAVGTVPTTPSEIFKQEAVDTSTNMLAGPNCPPGSVQTKWVAEFPDDNPYKIWLKQSPANVLSLGAASMVNPIVCTVHTSGYAGNYSYALSIVSYANTLLQQYDARLTQAQKDNVNTLLATLQSVISNPLSTDEALATSANLVKAAIDNAVASAQATPTPTPPMPTGTVPTSTPTPSQPITQ